MGFRIELEEIDSVTASINGVTSCAAVWLSEREDKSSCLLLYASCEGLKESDIKKELKARLPYYMQPDEIFLLDKMPLNSNGKVDRKFLKENSR
jgi:acyl-coenzyme A synthetase/AMP-(fatty) acid ligase